MEVASNGNGKKQRLKEWRTKKTAAASRSPQRSSQALIDEVGF